MPNDNKAPEPKKMVHRLQLKGTETFSSDGIFSEIVEAGTNNPVLELPVTFDCGNGWRYVWPQTKYRAIPGHENDSTVSVVESYLEPGHCVAIESSGSEP